MKTEDVKLTARCAAALAEDMAKSLAGMDDSASRLANNAERWRGWPMPTSMNGQEMLDYLTLFTSARNSKPSYYVDDPLVNGEKLPGRWRQVKARMTVAALGREERKKIVIAQLLRRVYLPATVAELAQVQYRRVRGNEVLKLFALHPGEGDSEALVWNDLCTDSKSFCEGAADAELAAIAGAGWSYADRKWEEGEQNVATFAVLLRKVSWINTVPTYELERFDGNGGYEKRKGYKATGVPIGSATTIVAALESAGHESAHWVDAGNGEAHIFYISKTSGQAGNYETHRASRSGRQVPSVTHTWYGVEKGDIETTYTTAKAYTGEGGDTGYVHKEAGRNVNLDGSGTVWATAWIPQNSGDSGNFWENWPDKENLLEHEVIIDMANDQWWYVSRQFTVYYEDSEADAYTKINGGLDGSKIYRVSGTSAHTWCAKKVTKILQSTFGSGDGGYPLPVNTGLYPAPTSI